MRFVIIGLGNFGSSLGERLVEAGYEVIGVDVNTHRVEQFKESLTFTIHADTSEQHSMEKLPIADADLVVVSIGEDVGASVTTVALLKKYYPSAEVIARAINPAHLTILQAMNVSEIIHPEIEYAQQLVNRFMLKGSLLAIPLGNEYEIVEIKTPEKFVGMRLGDLNLRNQFGMNVITIMRRKQRRNFLIKSTDTLEAIGVPTAETIFESGDLIVGFGSVRDIKKFCAIVHKDA